MSDKPLAYPSIEAPPPRQVGWLTLLIIFAALIMGAGVALTVWQIGYFALLVVPGVVVAIGAIRQPDLGFAGLLLLIFTQLNQVLDLYHEGVPSPARPLVLLLVAVILIRVLLYRERPTGWIRTSFILGLYIMFLLISMVNAQDFEIARDSFVNVSQNIVIAIIVIYFIQKPGSLKFAIWTLIVAGIFMGTISTFQYLTGTFGNNYWGFGGWELQQSGGVSRQRLTGPYFNPNAYAQVLIVIIPLAIDRLWHERNIILRSLAGWGTLVCALSVIFTFSRNGFVSMLFAIGILFVLRRPNFLPSILSIALLLGVLQFVPATYFDRISSLFQISTGQAGIVSDESFRGRLSENIAAIQMFQDHPIFGVGLNNFQYEYQDYSRSIGLDPRRELRSPASLYLEILSEQGLVGVFIFIYLIFIVLRRLFSSRNYFKRKNFHELEFMTTALIASFGGYMFLAISKNSAYSNVYWSLIAICLSVDQIVKNLEDREEQNLKVASDPGL
jgi:O-antigen ligase